MHEPGITEISHWFPMSLDNAMFLLMSFDLDHDSRFSLMGENKPNVHFPDDVCSKRKNGSIITVVCLSYLCRLPFRFEWVKFYFAGLCMR